MGGGWGVGVKVFWVFFLVLFFFGGVAICVMCKYVRRSYANVVSDVIKLQNTDMLPCRSCRSFLLPFLPITPLVSHHLGQHPEAKISRA